MAQLLSVVGALQCRPARRTLGLKATDITGYQADFSGLVGTLSFRVASDHSHPTSATHLKMTLLFEK